MKHDEKVSVSPIKKKGNFLSFITLMSHFVTNVKEFCSPSLLEMPIQSEHLIKGTDCSYSAVSVCQAEVLISRRDFSSADLLLCPRLSCSYQL